MSADNGIYILQTKDGQNRVIHTQAIDNIFGSKEDGINCLNAYEYFCDSKVTLNKTTAMEIAGKMHAKYINEFGIVEYGIQPIPVKLTWKQICEGALRMANDKIARLRTDISSAQCTSSEPNKHYVANLQYELKNVLEYRTRLLKTTESYAKNISCLHDVMKQWKYEAFGNSHIKNNFMYYERDELDKGVLTVYTLSPGWLIGAAGSLFKKYSEILSKFEITEIKFFEFKPHNCVN